MPKKRQDIVNPASLEMARRAGRRIRLIRELDGRSQKEVYEAVRVDQSTWSKWETGERMPDPVSIVRFCHLFRVSLDFIYLGDPARTNPVLVALIRASEPHLVEEPIANHEDFPQPPVPNGTDQGTGKERLSGKATRQ
jgi:transcriptional regulator with XRE-family HTH domain